MKKTVFILLFIFFIIQSANAPAIDIVVDFKKADIAVPNITAGGKESNSKIVKEMSRVLRFDLDNSGYFRVLPNKNIVDKLQRADINRGKTMLNSWSAAGAAILVKVDSKISGDQVKLKCIIYDLKTRSVIYSKSLTDRVSRKRYVVHFLVNSIVKELTGEEGIATTRIVFSADQGVAGQKEIYLMDYDGGNMKKLTADKTVSLVPGFGADGHTIYYTTYLKGYPKVVSLGLKSGKRKIVSSYAGLNAFPAVSPNGNEMALSLSKDGTVDIYRTDMDGKNPVRLTRSYGGVASSPCWSPDGKKIAFVSNSRGTAQVYVINRNGRNRKRISKGYSNATSVDWSPKGDLIAFSAKSGRSRQIFLADLRTGKTEQLTFGAGNHEKPSFAPDGIHLIYCLERNYEKDLYIIDVRDKRPVRVTSMQGNELFPDWSPVGY
jgi:TolB protein